MATPRPPMPNAELVQLKQMLQKLIQAQAPDLNPEQASQAADKLANALTAVKNISGKDKFNEFFKPENKGTLDVLVHGYAKAEKDPSFQFLTEKNNLLTLVMTPHNKMSRKLSSFFLQLKDALKHEHNKTFGPSPKPMDAMQKMNEELRDENNIDKAPMNLPSFKDFIQDIFMAVVAPSVEAKKESGELLYVTQETDKGSVVIELDAVSGATQIATDVSETELRSDVELVSLEAASDNVVTNKEAKELGENESAEDKSLDFEEEEPVTRNKFTPFKNRPTPS